MEDKALNDRLKKFVVPANNDWMEQIEGREENRDWLKLSGRIAARALTVMKAQKITQVQLAKAMGVTPQYVNKMLKGNEKFQIDTICKLERCLGVKLLEVPAATGLEYEAEGIETETSSFAMDFFEKILFETSKVADTRVAYTSTRSTTRVSKRKYPKHHSECKVLRLHPEEGELFSEAI